MHIQEFYDKKYFRNFMTMFISVYVKAYGLENTIMNLDDDTENKMIANFVLTMTTAMKVEVNKSDLKELTNMFMEELNNYRQTSKLAVGAMNTFTDIVNKLVIDVAGFANKNCPQVSENILKPYVIQWHRKWNGKHTNVTYYQYPQYNPNDELTDAWGPKHPLHEHLINRIKEEEHKVFALPDQESYRIYLNHLIGAIH